jgi:hypothetical protein
MGTQLSFTEENVKKNPFDYPKLKLAKGETALLTVVEDPYSEYVHSIQKPLLSERGDVLYRTAERKDGTEYSVPKLSFVSNPICLGDREVLDEDGIDPENCPICARAAAGGKGYVPKRRFAMHVIRTNTRPGKFEPTEPYGGQLIIWAFTDTIFNKLFGFQKQWGLKDHDLQLGPCTDADFQKAELQVAPNTAVDEATRAAIFAEKNRSEDPTVFCGNRKTKARILDDLAVVDAEWAKANGEDSGAAVSSTQSLNEGINALLEDSNDDTKDAEGWSKTAQEEGKPAESTEPITSFDDLPAAKETKAKPVSATADIDDILDNL